MDKFKAYRLREADKKVSGAFEQTGIDELDQGEVVIRVAYSGVNYKDALAATGKGRIIRRFPCIGGIDLSGTVVSSSDARFSKGDAVIATSYDIGVAHDGGYAEYARIPADWVVPMPRGLTLAEAMALGTAGYTAALGVVRMEQVGLRPGNGPVIVSGATGGVGSIAIDILSRLGYHVVALTGKQAETDYLLKIGAKEVMLRQSLDLAKIKALDAATWAGAVDNLGGEVLAWMASTMLQGGAIASIGLAASMSLNTSVAPFILRGVTLRGIDSVQCPMPRRLEAWSRLATDLDLSKLDAMSQDAVLADVPALAGAILQGQVRGRVVVDVNA